MRSRFGPHFTEKKGYPTDPKSIGEMIRKRRLDLALRQIDAAKMIGCDEMTIVNWEKGHRSPRVNHMAGVVELDSIRFRMETLWRIVWSIIAKRSA